MPTKRPAADWRDAQAYAPLLHADRSFYAWEWLRRDPAYREASHAAVSFGGAREAADGPSAGRWGLAVFEPPCRPVPIARPVWRADLLRGVLAATARPNAGGENALDLERLAELATMVGGTGRTQHLLLSDGFQAIRLDLLGSSLSAGPVRLHYRLSGFSAAERPVLTLRRLIALVRTGKFARSLHPPEPRARRWVLLLRTWDGLAAGACQREIAETLLSPRAGEARWRSSSPSLRLQAQRLVRGARAMAGGGYLQLLR